MMFFSSGGGGGDFYEGERRNVMVEKGDWGWEWDRE